MNPLSRKLLKLRLRKLDALLEKDPFKDRAFVSVVDGPYSWHLEWTDEKEKGTDAYSLTRLPPVQAISCTGDGFSISTQLYCSITRIIHDAEC
jgi:hypothetical protein